ncbi:hypothetical protein ACHHYP_01495 [Achlya hypogyna]|uniref:Uncharacterized protein n=1 Tax=Achlya hypogyna TaxID=1202772 RepID=A0A1V9ZTE8_ACHHY|nr:hypothetical protein ACHHYP_01495 [Achlya hypogyna]
METLLQSISASLAADALLQDHAFEDVERPDEYPTHADKPPPLPPLLPAPTVASREERLFELFTSFAIQTSSDDPTCIRLGSVIKLLQQCRIVKDTVATSSTPQKEQPTPLVALTIRDVEMLVSKLMKTKTTSSKLSYDNFLKFMWAVACQAHPAAAPSQAFKYIIDQCIQAPRTTKSRCIASVDEPLAVARKLLGTFETSLLEIFSYYALPPEAKHAMDRKPHLGARREGFYWSYPNALTFLRKYGLSPYITGTGFAHVYVDSLVKVDDVSRRLTYEGFCRLLVRVALRLTKSPDATLRLKALFQVMWLHCSAAKPGDPGSAQICGARDHVATGQALVKNAESQLFAATFLKMWRRDHLMDYMTQMYPPPPSTQMPMKLAMNEVLAAAPGHSVYHLTEAQNKVLTT